MCPSEKPDDQNGSAANQETEGSHKKGDLTMCVASRKLKHIGPRSVRFSCWRAIFYAGHDHRRQRSAHARAMHPNRPFAQLWPGNEVRGIAGEIRLRCVCFSLELSFFFCFGMSFSDHCCVPRFFNLGRASPSLFSHGFSRSSELKKRWLHAIRQADWSHFRVPLQQHGRIMMH